MTTEPLDRRQVRTDARDRLVNPLTGLRLRLEELIAGSVADTAAAQGLREALGLIDRLDDEVDEVLHDLLSRWPQDPVTSLIDVIGAVARRHAAAPDGHGRRLTIGVVDDVTVAADRGSLGRLVDRMVVDALLDHPGPVELRATARGGTVTVEVGLATPGPATGAAVGTPRSPEVVGALAQRCGGGCVPAAEGAAGVRVVLPIAG